MNDFVLFALGYVIDGTESVELEIAKKRTLYAMLMVRDCIFYFIFCDALIPFN